MKSLPHLFEQRLKEKLSTLAISVMNHWPNVKLRVIEGWDEDNRHSLNSLHYEGRAVDITTSDRDQRKYGMLARLAVEAGFDWVHYEFRSHVHCSVKSEKADTIRNNGCFDNEGLVETPNGLQRMSQLKTNDLVLTINPATNLPNFSPILMWMDRDEQRLETFVELQTESGQTIRLTPTHLIYIVKDDLISTIDNNNNNNNNNYNKNNFRWAKNSANSTGSGRLTKEMNVPKTNSIYSQKSNIFKKVLNLNDESRIVYAKDALVGQYLISKNYQKSIVDREQVETGDYNHGRQSYETTIITDSDVYSQKDPSISTNNNNLQNIRGQENQLNKAGGVPIIVYDRIVSVNRVTKRGIHAPLTREGNIIVNSVLASCYAVIRDQRLAHMSFAPVRWINNLSNWIYGPQINQPNQDHNIPNVGPPNMYFKSDHQESLNSSTTRSDALTRHDPAISTIHWYPMMLYRIGEFILPTRYLSINDDDGDAAAAAAA